MYGAFFTGCPSTTGGDEGGATTYTVTFNANDGGNGNSVTGLPAPITGVASGKAITQPSPNPARSGFDFGGWYKETGCTNAWNFAKDTVTANIILYAKWTAGNGTPYTPGDPDDPGNPGDPATPVTYTVTFDPDGGTVEGSTGVAAQTVTAGGKAADPGDAVKAGHTFSGWFNGDAKWDFESGTVSANLTLKAGWDLVLHTVTFNSNGGSAAAAQSITAGGTVTQPSGVTKTGYNLDAWYAASDFSGSAWNFTSDTVTADTTLNAKWTATPYTITYNLNGGTNHANNPANYTIESAAITLGAPSKTDFTFGGWYTEAGFINQVTGIAIAAGSTGNKTFWAKWTPLPPNSWTQVTTSQFGTTHIKGVTYGGPAGQEKFVAVGEEGKMAYSADGVNWTAVTDSRFSTYGINGVTYGGPAGEEKFVAVGQGARMSYSTDGVTWKPIIPRPFDDGSMARPGYGVTYGNGQFVAVGEGGRMAFSANGVNWTTITNSHFGINEIYGVTYDGNGKFVAVGMEGKIVYSTNGVNWTAVSSSPFGTTNIKGVTCGGPAGQEKFVAVGLYGKMAYSADGVTWTAVTAAQSTFDDGGYGLTIYGVTCGGPAGQKKFVAVGNNGKMAYSADGVTWTAVTATQSTFEDSSFSYISGVTYGSGKFVAVGRDGKIAYSNPQE